MGDSTTDRLHYMDLLRGILMMLGVVLHTLAIYTVNSDWKVSSTESTDYADPILNVIHLFRMPAFFIIAGYFSALVLVKQGAMPYVKSRFIRLGVPLIFAGILLNIPMALLINNGPSDIGWSQYILSGSWLGHLWFLGVLILYSSITAFLWRWIEPVINNNSQWTLLFSLLVLMLIFPISLRIGWYMEAMNIQLILLTVSNLFEYFPYFLFGLVFFFQSKYVSLGDKLHWWVAGSLVSYLLWTSLEIKILTDSLMFLMAIFSSLTLFAFFERYFNRPAKWKQDLANSSYTVYLVHQPIIILIALYMVEGPINIHMQIFTIMSTTVIFALIMHFKIVDKNKFLAFLMNGRPMSKGNNK